MEIDNLAGIHDAQGLLLVATQFNLFSLMVLGCDENNGLDFGSIFLLGHRDDLSVLATCYGFA